MAGYKEPGFQDRVAAAAKARNTALAKLKSKPPVDPEEQAKRVVEALAREAAQIEKRKAAQEAKLAAIAAAAEAERLAAEAAIKEVELTEAEKKAARDARYAARKSRKSSR